MSKATGWENRIGRRLRLRDLHFLFAVVQSGSMGKAAGHLGVSQPVVSEAIAGLEATIGALHHGAEHQGVGEPGAPLRIADYAALGRRR